jgi:hypothetical protein
MAAINKIAKIQIVMPSIKNHPAKNARRKLQRTPAFGGGAFSRAEGGPVRWSASAEFSRGDSARIFFAQIGMAHGCAWDGRAPRKAKRANHCWPPAF